MLTAKKLEDTASTTFTIRMKIAQFMEGALFGFLFGPFPN